MGVFSWALVITLLSSPVSVGEQVEVELRVPVPVAPELAERVAEREVVLASPPVVQPSSSSVWDRLAECESGGDWRANTGNGFYGGVQFTLSSWRWVGGTGYPHQHSRGEQIARAEILLDRQGWSAWPACSRKLGLRP